MGFTEDIAKLSDQVRKRLTMLLGNNLLRCRIVPFLSALGYAVYDPTEFIPEYVKQILQKIWSV